MIWLLCLFLCFASAQESESQPPIRTESVDKATKKMANKSLGPTSTEIKELLEMDFIKERLIFF
jgi:hypothetical protein